MSRMCRVHKQGPAAARAAGAHGAVGRLALLATVMALQPVWTAADTAPVDQDLDDVVSLLQRPTEFDLIAREPVAPLHFTIPLTKQYVPISKNGKVIAYKTSYFGHIQAGGPERQHFTVVFDTGSGHLILPSLDCESATCTKHRRYDRQRSQDAVDIEHDGKAILPDAKQRDQLSLSFGTGQVLGEFVRDKACFGPKETDCIKVHMVLAKQMTEDPFGLFEFDGVLGLGLTALALNPEFSFLHQMDKQNPTMQKHFAVFLSRHEGGRSAISFGGFNKQWAASEVKWVPVELQELGYWVVSVKNVRVGSTVLDECADGDCRAILDTGTSLLGVPQGASRNLHRLLARPVPGDDVTQRAATDCRSVPGSLIQFELSNGVEVSLTPEDYSRPQPLNITTPGHKDGWDLFCRSLLLPVNLQGTIGPKTFIWGEPVLRRYLTVYDWGDKRVGFAAAGQADEVGEAQSIGAPPVGSLAAGVPLSAAASTAAGASMAGQGSSAPASL